jgi:outer membrane protein assembly factor BamA
MRLAAGPSLKSSLAHTWTLDTQDNKIAGTSGAVTKLSQELAGLGGDAAFYKAEGEYTISRRVPGTTGMVSRECSFGSIDQTDGPTDMVPRCEGRWDGTIVWEEHTLPRPVPAGWTQQCATLQVEQSGTA